MYDIYLNQIDKLIKLYESHIVLTAGFRDASFKNLEFRV